VVFEVRRRDASKDVSIDAVKLSASLAKHCFGCVVTVPEVHVLTIEDVVVVARVVEVRADRDDEEEDEDDDEYRGVVTASTAAYVITDGAAPPGTRINLDNMVQIPPKNEQLDCVDVTCSDDEVFPVKRALLRPCLALTKAAQAGRGKYASAEEIRVPLDCCTFDRVLLYLQHAKRGAQFRFDPTLAPELLEAALALKIRGLEEDCRKVLGSFEERVRKSPIRLAEVRQRNAKGSQTTPRGETWLLLDGMVLDISRWLSEHPGGDSIIPQQALNCDSTVMFELYHVSRQSFLYLREFYVGELHPDDLADVPLPNKLPPGGDGGASPAFLAELRRHTRWRLAKEELVFPAWKSF
jgi:cytochrome b involved in lipid metabolism